jgi:hypothetical protein
MLSGAKHLAFSRCFEDEILRLRLRMTLRHSLFPKGRIGDFWTNVRCEYDLVGARHAVPLPCDIALPLYLPLLTRVLILEYR